MVLLQLLMLVACVHAFEMPNSGRRRRRRHYPILEKTTGSTYSTLKKKTTINRLRITYLW